MKHPSRRQFFKTAGLASTGALALGAGCSNAKSSPHTEAFVQAWNQPVLRRGLFSDPIVIESIDLLKRDDQYFVRARSKDGTIGMALTNRQLMNSLYPMFLIRIAPFFIGKDARDLDTLVQGVFTVNLNYKWQGAPFWMCVAWLEFAILDLMGKRIGQPVGALLGDRFRDKTSIYYANGDRKSPPENVVEQLKALIAQSGARAVKFKLGARMRYTEASNARDLAIIPLVREELGDHTTLYVDSNSSFDAPTAIRMGRELQKYGYDFFEEPVRFDDYEGTKVVADSLDIPIAGGEQESSQYRFQWLIEKDAVQIPQPDLLFFGGLIRSIRVARMAKLMGKKVVPHMSGFGLGILYVLHYASVVTNSNEFQEFKGDKDGIPYIVVDTGKPLESINGEIGIPKAPGLGVEFDPDYLSAAKVVQR